ncbi:DUF488 domain-containing protein [Terricaulis silvestris]|uniref:DUF488 domain-containing protein n=1 Tax=Terricaulis silvestris TaxID=2686094 RepID=A0A6I6MJA2_9CAUL|nr:DUF488 domain-containing protein [Terricaulis silvestris]QGZ93931.1 hypothetical protein DSM104635_00746 [Terricaulis silvestris]
MAAAKIWTIGYEKVGQGDFVAALKAAKIKTLVDVREVANSRRAGFSKKSLAAALNEAGIAYIHMKPLGTPKAGREAARKGDTKTMTRIFEARMVEPESQMALAETAELAGKGRTCIMCLEHDWRDCHRTIVAKHLAKDFGLKAENLSPTPKV